MAYEMVFQAPFPYMGQAYETESNGQESRSEGFFFLQTVLYLFTQID